LTIKFASISGTFARVKTMKRWPLWVARLMFGGAVVGVMIYEWNRWPNGSRWLGPVGFIWYNGAGCFELPLCAFSLALLFAFLLRPHPISAVISLFGVVNWLCWGEVAKGIGC
jgi:hypothetical protein